MRVRANAGVTARLGEALAVQSHLAFEQRVVQHVDLVREVVVVPAATQKPTRVG